MQKLITSLLVIAALLLTNDLSAQTKTPYQKKTELLSLQFFKDLGVDPATIKKYSEAGDIGALFLLGNISQKLQTEKGMLAFFRYKQNLQNAEKLKNATDFKRDAAKKLTEKKKSEIELIKQQEGLKKSQLAEKEEEREISYQNSDFVVIGNSIKTQFENWAKRGEFEKTIDYDSRIANESSIQFENTSFNKLNAWTSPYLKENMNSNSNRKWLNINLKNYDADKELYYLEVLNGYRDEQALIGTVKLSPAEAVAFKNNFRYYQPVVEVNDWILSNYNLRPSKVSLFLSRNISEIDQSIPYVVNFDIKDETPIIYSTSELKIDIPNLTSTSFNYTTQASEMVERLNRKQLEKETEDQVQLDEKKKLELEERFKSLVNSINFLEDSDKFEYFKTKKMPKTLMGAYFIYNRKKMNIYIEALKIKEDIPTKNKLVECELIEKEIEQIRGDR